LSWPKDARRKAQCVGNTGAGGRIKSAPEEVELGSYVDRELLSLKEREESGSVGVDSSIERMPFPLLCSRKDIIGRGVRAWVDDIAPEEASDTDTQAT